MEEGLRWGRLPWFAAWSCVAAAQVAVLSLLRDDTTVMVTALTALQLVKVPAALPRLRDLGRPPDDVMWTIVPLLNVGLFRQLFEATPGEELRRKRIRSWSTQLSMVEAYRVALGAMGATAAKVLPVTVVVGGAAAVLSELVSGWIHAGFDDETVRLARADLLTWVVGLAGLYTLTQLFKRKTATRASWLPSLVLLPALFGLIALRAAPFATGGAELVVAQLPYLAADLLIWSFASGFLVLTWVRAALPALSADEASPEVSGTLGDVTAVLGGRTQAVAVAMQALYIPGIYLSIVWAFADLIALVQPERAAFSRSQALARGIYTKLFRMLTVWFLVTLGLDVMLMAPWEPLADIAQTLVGIPGLVGPEARVLAAFGRMLANWWCVLAILAVFLERDSLMSAHEARKAEQVG